METILSWVKSGLLFGVFGSVVLMLAPNKSYVKHIGMVVGMLFILVMVHPLMMFLNIDGSTYASYIKNFLLMEPADNQISEKNIELYEESLEIQLIAVLEDNGYSIKRVRIYADENGNVEEVEIVFGEEVRGMEQIELYIKNLFGEETAISYERE